MLYFNFYKTLSLPFFKRLISVIIFIPLIILPIIFNGIYLVAIYLFFLSLILLEIRQMLKLTLNKTYFYWYIFISIFSFFFFIIILLTNIADTKLFICIILVIWVFDTFSYIGGSLLKGVKIFPRISKGKTYTGLLSGFTSVILFSIMLNILIEANFIYFIMLNILISFTAFIGDILVSLMKRSASIKDSGTIIPGHGGLLDRMDSFILVFFVVGLWKIFTLV